MRLFSKIDHRGRENVVRTSVTHSAFASCATFLFLPHFDVICDLSLNRRTATWNLFVNYSKAPDHKLKIYSNSLCTGLDVHLRERNGLDKFSCNIDDNAVFE